jgi:hypothetical protein
MWGNERGHVGCCVGGLFKLCHKSVIHVLQSLMSSFFIVITFSTVLRVRERFIVSCYTSFCARDFGVVECYLFSCKNFAQVACIVGVLCILLYFYDRCLNYVIK